MEANKVFIIGIDGGTWKILRPLIQDGTMPNLAKLEREGTSSILKSTIPPVTAPAWTSFQTGVNPGKHGIFEFNNYIPGTYRTSFVNSTMIPLKTIWQIASEAGKKVIVVNVPVTYPPYKVNGCMVTGLLTPSTKNIFTYPEELSREILEKVPGYRIMTTRSVYNLKGLNAFLKALIDTERKRTELMLYLMRKNDWDLAMVHFQSSDELQHSVYRHLDSDNPFFSRKRYERIKFFYRELDKNMGRLINCLPNFAIKIVLSDHGFCSVDKKICLNSFLVNNSWLAINKKRLRRHLLAKFLWFMTKLDRFNISLALLGRKRRKLRESLWEGSIIDWQKTKAFMINGWVYANLYINLIGRERDGIVPVEDYDSLCEEIRQKLLSLRDKNGLLLIEKVCKKNEVYSGIYSNNASDFIVIPKKGYEFNNNVLDRILKSCRDRRDHLGSHDGDGILVIQGEGLQKIPYQPSIVDLCPTILNLLGIAAPEYMDGKALDIFPGMETSAIASGQVEEGIKPDLCQKNFSEEDEKLIQKRLKDLGYI